MGDHVPPQNPLRPLETLGLGETASWEDIERAHERLVADLTPGPEADHKNVEMALEMLAEVNEAFARLRHIQVA